MNCIHCNKEIPNSPTKPRKFCSNACRVAHKRLTLDPSINPKSIPGISTAADLTLSPSTEPDQFSPFQDHPKSRKQKQLDQIEPPTLPKPKIDFSKPPYTIPSPDGRMESITLDTGLINPAQLLKFYLS